MTSMSVRARIVFAVCGLTVLAHGCADHRAWTKSDAWYHPPRYAVVDLPGFNPVPWAEVKPDARARAEQLLAQSSAVALAPDEVVGYAGARPDHGGLTVYLVRALYLNRGGHFDVRSDGRDLYVGHASLGRRAVPMTREPLLVALPAEPRNVYVYCGMAE